MRIDCPHCSASYDLPPDKVPPGRSVRCARCTKLWTPVPLVVAPAVASQPRVAKLEMAAPVPEEARGAARRPDAAHSVMGRLSLPGAWLLTVLVMAALGWAAVTRRAEIIHAWPPSERAYIALGLAPLS